MNHPAIYEEITLGKDRLPIGHVIDVEPIPNSYGDNLLSAVVQLDNELLAKASQKGIMLGVRVFLGDRRVGRISGFNSTLMHGEWECKAEIDWVTEAMSQALETYQPVAEHHELQEIFDDMAAEARNAPKAPPFKFPNPTEKKEDPVKEEDQVKDQTEGTATTTPEPAATIARGPLEINLEPGAPQGISYVSDARM
ncbi:hypothetical protein LCGC14_2238090, partial [marine sediment metagenome]